MKIALTTTVAALLCCGTWVSTQQDALAELIRNVKLGEEVMVTLSPMRPAMALPAVLSLSDVVIEGRVMSVSTEPSELPHYLSTKYVLAVDHVWFDRRPLAPNPRPALATVAVRHEGGRLEYQGRIIKVTDSTLPHFELGSELVLFLRSREEGSVFSIVDGPFGAFEKNGGRIGSFLPRDHESSYDGITVSDFRAMVMNALSEPR